MNTFNIVLDLDKSIPRKPPTVRIRQGDEDGTTISAEIFDHGTALSATVSACHFVMRLPNGTNYYRKAATYSGGVATVLVDETQAASVTGTTALAYFQLTVGTAICSTGAFTVFVEPDAVGDAEVPEDYDTAIQDAIDRCNAAAAAVESMAPLTNAEIDAITQEV